LVSDDEREGRQGSSENEYEMGSFVCDDADLSFDCELSGVVYERREWRCIWPLSDELTAAQDGSDPLDSQR
jgi:hypothetical protein